MRQLEIPSCIECNTDIEPNDTGLCDTCYERAYCQECGEQLVDTGSCAVCCTGEYDGQ